MIDAYKPTPEEATELKIKPHKIKVSGDQVFFTLQGEGQSIGKAAVFLRLHFCNLRCGWCDTKYTWDKKTPEFWKEGEDWTLEQAVKNVSQFPANRLVITGGEPMLQQPNIAKLMDKMPDWIFEVETNGTIPPMPSLAERCQFNVSPKLENSGNPFGLRFKPAALRRFNALPKTTFKFVVQQAEDLKEIDKIVDDCNLDPAKIIIMPEGTTQDEIINHAVLVADDVKNRNWRLIPRLQTMLWGSQRQA